MFCPECGMLMYRIDDGKLACRTHNPEAFAKVEQARKEFEKQHTFRGGEWHRKDTASDKRERQERAVREFLVCVPGAHQATPAELRKLGYRANAAIIVLNDGRLVRLCTNGVHVIRPRFPYVPSDKVDFDYVAFALTDINPDVVTAWWIMKPAEILQYWELVGELEHGYVEVDHIGQFSTRWDRVT